MTKTEKVITSMLTENTGSHMLDSGGAYGRNYEHNQGKSFEDEPAAVLNFEIYNNSVGIEVTLDLYHWLVERLEFAEEEQARFDKFNEREDMKDELWCDVLQAYTAEFFPDDTAGGGYNTYNGECLLSQGFQFWTLENAGLVIIQIHGGCDIRGGYTAPKFFYAEEYAMFYNADATIQPGALKPEHGIQLEFDGDPVYDPYWQTDDAYHWYRDGSTAYKQLEQYEATQDETERGKGKLFIDEDGNGYCPITGRILIAYS